MSILTDEIKAKVASTDYTFQKGQYQIRSGRLFSRVTSVLSTIKFDDGALDRWKKRMQVKAFSDRIDLQGSYKGVQVFNEFSAALDYPETYMNSSANFGTNVHAWIEKYMETGEFPPLPEGETYADINMCLKSVQKFFMENDLSPKTVEVVKPELFVYSNKYGYAGSADFVCVRGDKCYLFDWKTSNGYRVNYALQLAAYAKAIEELYGLHVYKGNCVVFAKDRVSYETHPQDEKMLDFYFELFKACLIMHNFVKHMPIPDMSVNMKELA